MNTVSFRLALFYILWVATVGGFNTEPTENYPYTKTLVEGSYILYWRHNDTHITFETHVKTLGWVGFGISDNGNMYPADVIIGWVKNGNAFLEDRKAVEYAEPEVDKQQDWHLLSGMEVDDTTILKFERALDTCDTAQDRPITKDLTHVIYSWHNGDPDPRPIKHVEHGSKQMYLLDPTTPKVEYPADARAFDFTSNEAMIPPKLTYYHCRAIVFPYLDIPYHTIAYEPIVEAGNEDIVHHLVVKACPMPFNDSNNGTSWECTDFNVPSPEYKGCYTIYAAWAVGGETFYLPEDVGMPLGAERNRAHFVLEIHYNNVGLQEGRVDSSGLRAIYTPTLRRYEAEVLEVGVHISPIHFIPPHYKNFISRGECPGQCLRPAMDGKGPMRVFSVFLHTHLLGRKVILRHIRNGVELEPIAVDNNYDFDFQQPRILRTERIVEPDDTLIVDCSYDSSGKTSGTRGGGGTDDEMCLAFISYYPRMTKVAMCTSVPTYNTGRDMNTIYQKLGETFTRYDWNNVFDRLNFQCLVEDSEVFQLCMGEGHQDFFFREAAEINKRYIPKSKCSNAVEDVSHVNLCQTGSSPQNQAAFELVVAFSIIKLLVNCM